MAGVFFAPQFRNDQISALLDDRLQESEGSTLLARIEGLRSLNFEIMELILKPERLLDYRAGQFIRLYNPEGASRSYSLASVPDIDRALALHIRLYPEGLLSPWVHHRLRIGVRVSISEPLGECFYLPGKSNEPLLLIGTGSGLAPLYGILLDALQKGHTGPIHLYHGARTPEGLYLTRDIEHLAAHYPNFRFAPCFREIGKELPTGILKGRPSRPQGMEGLPVRQPRHGPINTDAGLSRRSLGRRDPRRSIRQLGSLIQREPSAWLKMRFLAQIFQRQPGVPILEKCLAAI